MKYARHKLLLLAALAIVFVTTGLGCKGGSLEAQRALKEPVHLEFWGVFDSSDAFNDLIGRYTASRTNVSITYRKLQFGEYERALLDAWAEGRGPDIFMVHNTWVGGYVNKISPMPDKLTIPIVSVTQSGAYGKKSETVELREVAIPRPEDIRNKFVTTVYNDAIRDGGVYGLPLAVDTLVLFYNRSLFDQANIVTVPRTWQEIKEASQRLTRYDDEGGIVRSGIALGGANNINRSFDILSLLMAQNGTVFTTPDGRGATFSRPNPFSTDQSFKPGPAALQFYTDFANPSKETYTWSETQPAATEQFISGNLGMMLGYSYQLPLLKAQGPKVNLGIAPAPHINADGTDATGDTINWANYWLLSAAKATEHKDYVWDFIVFATVDAQNASVYLNKTDKPTALRELIPEQLQDPQKSIFAQQLLTSRSWYRGASVGAVENTFRSMITEVALGRSTADQAIRHAEGVVNQSLQQR